MNIRSLGAARFPSPLGRWVNESERVPATILRTAAAPSDPGLLFELAGARENLFFHPAETRAGIVTCGGLCPGLNDVIRSLFFEMHHAYGVKRCSVSVGDIKGWIRNTAPNLSFSHMKLWIEFICKPAQF